MASLSMMQRITMKTLLQINSSIFSSGGQSTQLADQFVAAWLTKELDARVIVRDLAVAPISHLDAQRVLAFFAQPETRTQEQQAYVAESDALIEEIKQAQVIVIGLPMYNFGVPSTLKAYFDQIARSEISFRYTESGAEGLLTGKKVYVFATRGGMYAGTPLDSQTNYVRDFLGFLGMNDVEFVYAEGLNMGETAKDTALVEAKVRLTALAA